MQNTLSTFWDCECPENYIHPARFTSCPVCGATRDDQPDARPNEISEAQAAGLLEAEEIGNLEPGTIVRPEDMTDFFAVVEEHDPGTGLLYYRHLKHPTEEERRAAVAVFDYDTHAAHLYGLEA